MDTEASLDAGRYHEPWQRGAIANIYCSEELARPLVATLGFQ